MRFGNGTRPHLVTDTTQAGDFGEDQTEPGADVVVSNRTLYKLIQGLSSRITALAVAVVVLAGSMLLVGLLMYWSRPK